MCENAGRPFGVDALNEPLFDTIREHYGTVFAVNEHIGPRHLPRQTSVWGQWIAGVVEHWGVPDRMGVLVQLGAISRPPGLAKGP